MAFPKEMFFVEVDDCYFEVTSVCDDGAHKLSLRFEVICSDFPLFLMCKYCRNACGVVVVFFRRLGND